MRSPDRTHLKTGHACSNQCIRNPARGDEVPVVSGLVE
jgi:hypothetical protein